MRLLQVLTSHNKQLGVLVSPSVLSGSLVVLVSLAVTLGAIGTLQYQGSGLQYLLQLQHNKSHATSTPQPVPTTDNPPAKVAISNLPLLVLWAGVGLLAYWFLSSFVTAFRQTIELKQSLSYINADRAALLKQVGIRLLVRGCVLLVWCFYTYYTVHLLLPYVILAADTAAGPIKLIISAGYVIWSVVLLAIALHLHVILARLFFWRPRLI